MTPKIRSSPDPAFEELVKALQEAVYDLRILTDINGTASVPSYFKVVDALTKSNEPLREVAELPKYRWVRLKKFLCMTDCTVAEFNAVKSIADMMED